MWHIIHLNIFLILVSLHLDLRSTSAGVYYKTFSSLKQEPKLSALKVPLARASRE